MKRVVVEWVDSMDWSGWHDKDEIMMRAEKESQTVWTMGYVLEDNAKYILLCQGMTDSHEVVLNPFRIPKEVVREVRELN